MTPNMTLVTLEFFKNIFGRWSAALYACEIEEFLMLNNCPRYFRTVVCVCVCVCVCQIKKIYN